MKPHLPLKLRAALLAALVAVSFTAYSPAWAEEGSTTNEDRVYTNETFSGNNISTSQNISDYETVNISNTSITGSPGASGGFIAGGAIKITWSNVDVKICANGYVSIANNKVTSDTGYNHDGRARGAGVYMSQGQLLFEGNEEVCFATNTVVVDPTGCYISILTGGAVYSDSDTAIIMRGNKSTIFQGNAATAGASCGKTTGNATSNAAGGAIYVSGVFTIEDSPNIKISSNRASATASGGTVSGPSTAKGGAVYNAGILSIADSIETTFEKNKVNTSVTTTYWGKRGSIAYGGALNNGSEMSIMSVKILNFLDNSASSSIAGSTRASSYAYSHGGAIYNDGNMGISNCGEINFLNNSTAASSLNKYAIFKNGAGNIHLAAQTIIFVTSDSRV